MLWMSLVDVTCPYQLIPSDKSQELLCIYIQQQLRKEDCELSPLETALTSPIFLIGWLVQAVSYNQDSKLPNMLYN